MRGEAFIHDPTDHRSSRPFGASEKTKFFRAEEVEARIERVCDRCRNLSPDLGLVRLKTDPHVCNPGPDLQVKVEAVRWMVKIAKHMSEPAREVVLLRIENSLRQLESAVEARPHSRLSEAIGEPLNRSTR